MDLCKASFRRPACAAAQKYLSPGGDTAGALWLTGRSGRSVSYTHLVILGLMLGYTSWQVTLIGAIVLVASGVLTEREAIENMNMSTVLLYVGVSAFGTALAQTGAAEMLADVFSKMLDGITNGYIAVSYTHLDVYKRQHPQ